MGWFTRRGYPSTPRLWMETAGKWLRILGRVRAVAVSSLSAPSCRQLHGNTFTTRNSYRHKRCSFPWRLSRRIAVIQQRGSEVESIVEDEIATSDIPAPPQAPKGKKRTAQVASETRTLLVIQPDQKYGVEWPRVAPEHKLEEAVSLTESISGWEVTSTRIDNLRRPHNKYLFGTGKMAELRQDVGNLSVDSVFINIPVLTPLQQSTLQSVFNKEVFDRFSIVLRIFKERAHTQQAKVQVELAEIPYLRSRLAGTVAKESARHQQRGVSGKMAGGGENPLQVQQLELARKEKSLQQKLEQICAKRQVNRAQRRRNSLPVVAVVGYTNAGKTTLIKALSKDETMEPQDMLFATLDTTVHAGRLPSGLRVLYVDTSGFISDLPHELVDSFASTLEDVVLADVLIHVRDASHPQTDAQRANVLKVLQQLQLKPRLLDTMIEVLNKRDKVEEGQKTVSGDSISGSLSVSAKHQQNLDPLKFMVEAAVLKATGQLMYRIVVPADGPQLRWLHSEATVCSINPVETLSPKASSHQLMEVRTLLSQAAHGKFIARFKDSISSIQQLQST